MKEREAKLAAPPGLDLPPLGGPEDGYAAEPLATRRLSTTYYDTPDLRLARWGASLRYRPGEGWTVKLPEGEHGVLLVRAEHVFGGDGRRPPAEALALVRPFVRTPQLSPASWKPARRRWWSLTRCTWRSGSPAPAPTCTPWAPSCSPSRGSASRPGRRWWW